MPRDMLIWIVEGVGTAAGAMSVLSTCPLTSALRTSLATQLGAASVTETPCLDPTMDLPAASVGILAATSSDQGYRLDLPYLPPLSWLTSALVSPYVHSRTEPIRVTESITAAATTVTVDGNGTTIAAGQYIWIDRERMLVTSRTSTTLTVTRARLGTRATAHEYHAPGFVILDRHPQTEGQVCRLYRGEIGAETFASLTLLHAGYVERVADTGSLRIGVDVGSAWARAARAKWSPATGTSVESRALIGWHNTGVEMGATAFTSSTSPWAAAIVWAGDRWAVYPVTTYGTAYICVVADGPTACGKNGIAYPPAEWEELWEGKLHTVTAIHRARVWQGDPLSTVVGDILSEDIGAALPPDMIGDLTPLDGALGLASIEIARGLGAWVPLWPDGTILDRLSALCASVGCALIVGRSGVIRALDWGSTVALTYGADIVAQELREIPYTRTSDADAGLLEVRIEGKTLRTEIVERIISDIGTQVGGAGAVREIDAGDLSIYTDELRERWLSLMWAWERPRKILAASLLPRTLDIGDVVRVDIGQMPLVDGTIAPPGAIVAAKVIAVGESLQDRTISASMALMLGRGADRAGVYTPVATIAADQDAADTVIAIESADWSAADWSAWTGYVGAFALLCDPALTILSATPIEIASVTTDEITLSSPGLPIGASAGDLLILAYWDDQPSAFQAGPGAWLADADAELGTGDDDPQIYSD